MPFLKVHVQFVRSTKSNISYLAIKEVRKIIWNHIRTNADKNKIRVNFINGYFDYYHCLLQLEPGQTIEKVIKILKGEKTFRIDKKGMLAESSFQNELPPFPEMPASNKFEWNDDYFAIAISEPPLDRISNYTHKQLDDNDEKLFNKEYVIQYGFQKFVDK
jgi:putative transposase